MEELNSLNTHMIVYDPNKNKRYTHCFHEETYLESMVAVEKIGLQPTSENIVNHIIERLPTIFPDYKYESHTFSADGEIKLNVVFEKVR